MLHTQVTILRRLHAMRDAARRRLNALQNDKRGVVSFEYVLVAACIVAAVAAAYGTGGSGAIKDALTTGIGDVTSAFTTAAAAGS